MNEESASQEANSWGGRRFLPPLVLLFAGSGCAALIYEIVWFQMLQLVIGSSAVSLAVLLGTFMGGMCLGSLALPRLVSPRRHPLRVCALLETGIGVFGLAALLLVPSIARLYVAIAAHGLPGILVRGAVCGVCLLPPTLLMGATLPAVSRWVETTPQGVSWLGFFYGSNIAGAVLGCLLAGFYLLRVYDMAVATCAAAAINLVVASLALVLAALTPASPGGGRDQPGLCNPESKEETAAQELMTPASPRNVPNEPRLHSETLKPESRNPNVWLVYVSIALSGACALAAEVVWTRLLSLMLGATVYTFSIILAVFLVGLGIGSGIGSLLARAVARPRMALGVCQVLLVAAIALAAHLLAKSLPYWPINPSLSTDPWFNFQLDLLRCAWVVLPAACLWGASFPLALAAAASDGQDPGRLVGRVYAANTLGAILGALACGLILIPWLGTQQVQRLMMGLSFLGGALMFAPLPRSAACRSAEASSASSSSAFSRGRNICSAIMSVAFLLVAFGWAALLARDVPKVPWDLVAYGRYLPTKTDVGTNLFMGEGMNASVAVTELSSGVRNFHVSGKIEASTDAQDMRLQRMLGHLPALLHPRPRSVLIVGCGAGVTAGSFTLHPTVERMVICEIEPLIPRVVARYFAKENYNVLQDPRLEVVYDDARHYVLTTREKFDIITSDPIHPWVKGAATLYTKEYFETCRRRLNPGGLVTQWVPLYESNLAAVKSEVATFFEVFPDGTIWSNDQDGEGYDVVLLGSADPLQIDLGQVQRRLGRADHQRVAQSLREAGFKSALGLLGTYAGQASDLKPWLSRAEINRDVNLRLQYLAGMGLNLYQPDSIYSDILFYRKFPNGLFVGSDEWSQALRSAIERPRANK
jgi:spermidine synthase